MKIDNITKDKLYVPINISTSLNFINDWNEEICTKHKR